MGDAQQIPHAWKRDEAALRRFVEAALGVGRTDAPWRDLPDDLGHWPSEVDPFFGSPALRYWWRIRRGSCDERTACAPHLGDDAAQASGGG